MKTAGSGDRDGRGPGATRWNRGRATTRDTNTRR